uniref:Uncharacterized protein n=1 Tax=viral metagenome TaxID=1070528 RepID=A0A6H1ZU39_9ZZZZ
MDINNLLSNKLLLQYLSGAGAAISAGQPAAPALNQVTQQNISTQNFAKLLAQVMGGKKVPEGTKMSIDHKGFKFEGPRNILGGTAENTALAQEGAQLPGGSGIDWQSKLNPFR